MIWVGNVFIALGLVAAFLGILGVFRFKEFQMRLLAAAKVDTVALLAILLGVMLRSGFSWFSLKAAFIALIVVIANPIVTSQVSARALTERRGAVELIKDPQP